MELDDLKRRWEAQDSKLDAVLRLNASLLQATLLRRTRGTLRWLTVYLWIEVLLGGLSVLLLGSFWFDHLHEPRFLIPGLALHAVAVTLIIVAGRQLAALHQIDYSAPVIEIQRRLGTLQIRMGKSVLWTLLASPLLWAPLVIVTLQGLFGVDAYAILGSRYLAANLGMGLAVLAVALWVARRYAGRMESAPRLRALLRALGGHSLNRAIESLESLDRFERS